MTPQLRQVVHRAAENAADTYSALLAAKQLAERFSEHRVVDELESLAAIAQDLHEAIGELLVPATADTNTPSEPSKS